MTASDYGAIAGLLAGLGAIARLIWRWERTFQDSAIEELKRLREELDTMRRHVAWCEQENADLRREVEALKRRLP